jgi:eukaryotic-like serine/threonine-protein kinase
VVGAPHLQPGRVVAGRYRVERLIGSGGMGAVYLVRHVNTDEALAMKVLHAHALADETAVERFRREARAPAKIASEHVARVTDADTAPDLSNVPFYVMEYLDGRDLERIVLEKGPLAPSLVVEYLRQAARALDRAHAMGIIHRDLKPENLFVTHREDGSPCIKLLDFGIARLADSNEAGSHLKTKAGYVFGTPSYMSPEQTTGDHKRVGPATDVWALGLVAFKLLVGEHYWTADTPAHVCAKVLTERIAPPSERGSTHGPAFDAWFARCVAREVHERFQSAGEAASALGDALGIKMRARSSASFPAAPFAATVHASGSPVDTKGVAQPLPAGPSAHPSGSLANAAESPVFARDPTLLPAGVPRKRSGVAFGVGLLGLLVGVGTLTYILVSGVRRDASSARPSVSVVADAGAAPSATASAPTQAPEPPPAAVAVSAAPTEPEPEPEPTAAPGHAGTRKKTTKGDSAGSPKASATSAAPAGATKETPKEPAKEEPSSLSREQKNRLESLQRLCDQGTFSAKECQAKRQAIMRGDH